MALREARDTLGQRARFDGPGNEIVGAGPHHRDCS